MFEHQIRRWTVALALTVPVSAWTVAAHTNDVAKAHAKQEAKLYIVQMVDAPVVAYEGSIMGLRATRPSRGRKIDPNDSDVVRYAGYLTDRHDDALRRVGGGRKAYSYTYSFNGFAAEVSLAQAEALKSVPGVVAVTRDEMRTVDTSSTPAFLGLTAANGLWHQLGGVQSAGENVVIGIIDTGIWPEHLSFSDRTGVNGNASSDGKLAYTRIPGWHGACVPGEAFNASHCNEKLIGARYYNAGFGGNAGINARFPSEYNSPRDFDGHGTHTASTAGGNHNVEAIGDASMFGMVSGIAPRARIAAYKTCWTAAPNVVGCWFSDSVAAIDRAVADGVDVINFSVSGTDIDFLDPVEIAFLFAADAGIFVAAAAGNDGPTASTVAHPSPWLTTVAAGTHNRAGRGSLTLGDGATLAGASLATAVGPVPLIDSTAAGLPGADPAAVALCLSSADNGGTPVLDPSKIAGKIVVCDRGLNTRIKKSFAVREGGGAGMILVNTSASSINADLHFVPTVHLPHTDRTAVKAYASTTGASATINRSALTYDMAAPFIAAFSSRGPLLAGGGDLLKPDVAAPGTDIVAAIAPPRDGRLFDILSGTSMSTPHVAGLGALLKNLHPSWSPMAIKSALMTSAGDVLDGSSSSPVVIFGQGAGHVRPNNAADPGLVFDHGFHDWLAFLCGATNGVDLTTCSSLGSLGFSLNPADLNGASIAIGKLAGIQAVKRRVTNVGAVTATYDANVTGITGVAASVSPASLTLAPGQSGAFTVTFTQQSAAFNSYVGGQLTWSDGMHNARIPVVARPVSLVTEAEVSGDGTALSYGVKFGYTGPFAALARGLTAATRTAASVSDDPGNEFVPGGTGTRSFNVIVPAGTTYARFSLFNSSVSSPSDLDLYMFDTAGSLVGMSIGSTSDEEISLVNPAAGAYTVWVHGWAVTGTANFTLWSWMLDSSPTGNMTASAASATLGGTGTIDLSFGGLTPGTKYLGSVAYSGAPGMPDPTIVRVDTP